MKKHYYLIVAMTFCFANVLTAQQLPLLTNPVVSDLNYMMEITPIQQALPNLLKLRGVRYFWNPNANSKMKFSQVTQIGLVAQELEQEFSEIVFEDKATGAKTIDYGRLTPIIVEAIKELSSKNEKLEIENKSQAEKLKDLQSQLDEIKRKLEGSLVIPQK